MLKKYSFKFSFKRVLLRFYKIIEKRRNIFMKILGVIPARYASSRFEGKPLKDICGHAMIEWVYKRAKNADIDEIVVATDDERIFKAVEKFGGNVVMTAENHQNGTSRIIEVINKNDDIPWSKIIGLRNKIVHDYGEILTDRIWLIASKSIPELINLLNSKKFI